MKIQDTLDNKQKLLELDMSLGGGPNIGPAADSDSMRDAGFKTIMELLSE